MKFPPDIPVYGDRSFRGKCPTEMLEQVSFFNWVRQKTPYGEIAIHIRNEGLRNHLQVSKHKIEGMCTGAADIIIPARIPFVCEMKRQDHTKSAISDDQIKFLLKAQAHGAFVCIALGCKAALEALKLWEDK